MHGNTVKLPDGRKTRALEDVEAEVRGFVAVLNAHGRPAGGLHLETTPDDVTECVDERRSLSAPELPRYRTSCDPRLNPRQAAAVTAAFGTALEEGAAA
jgi:3-deoxy-7-phosphoheptulonate synthase